jgi:hypothetical protein
MHCRVYAQLTDKTTAQAATGTSSAPEEVIEIEVDDMETN